jgi:hypothetical protein
MSLSPKAPQEELFDTAMSRPPTAREKELVDLLLTIAADTIKKLKRGFYSENKFTLALRDLAEDVTLIERFKAKELYWRDDLLKKMAEAVDENKPETLLQLGNALAQYKDGFRNLPYENAAALHVLMAGQILSMRFRPFSRTELKALSRELWAHAICRSKGIPSDLSEDDPRFQLELKRLPEIKWARLWRKMGIKVKNRSKSTARSQ